jgi:hypothetical protein
MNHNHEDTPAAKIKHARELKNEVDELRRFADRESAAARSAGFGSDIAAQARKDANLTEQAAWLEHAEAVEELGYDPDVVAPIMDPVTITLTESRIEIGQAPGEDFRTYRAAAQAGNFHAAVTAFTIPEALKQLGDILDRHRVLNEAAPMTPPPAWVQRVGESDEMWNDRLSRLAAEERAARIAED